MAPISQTPCVEQPFPGEFSASEPTTVSTKICATPSDGHAVGLPTGDGPSAFEIGAGLGEELKWTTEWMRSQFAGRKAVHER